MKPIEFLKRIHEMPFVPDKTLLVFDEFVHSVEFQNYNELNDDAKNFFEEVWAKNEGKDFSSLLSKLDCCLDHCKTKEKNKEVFGDSPYGVALSQAKKILEELLKIYNGVAQSHQKEKIETARNKTQYRLLLLSMKKV